MRGSSLYTALLLAALASACNADLPGDSEGALSSDQQRSVIQAGLGESLEMARYALRQAHVDALGSNANDACLKLSVGKDDIRVLQGNCTHVTADTGFGYRGRILLTNTWLFSDVMSETAPPLSRDEPSQITFDEFVIADGNMEYHFDGTLWGEFAWPTGAPVKRRADLSMRIEKDGEVIRETNLALSLSCTSENCTYLDDSEVFVDGIGSFSVTGNHGYQGGNRTGELVFESNQTFRVSFDSASGECGAIAANTFDGDEICAPLVSSEVKKWRTTK